MEKRVKYKLYAIPPEGEAFTPFQGDGCDLELSKGETFKYTGKVGTAFGVEKYWGRCAFDGMKRCTFELRPWLDKQWRKRESNRLRGGYDDPVEDYSPLPEAWKKLKLPEGHYTHRSREAPAEFVAFTENEEKGMRDVQTRMRAGKYIKKFFPDLDNEQVRYYASAIQAYNTVHMTDDPELAATVYINGPHSCMSKRFHIVCEDGTVLSHPVAAYFAGDLKLAWMGDAAKASARCLVWPEAKTYGRIYGATTTMAQALKNLGFSCGYDGDRSTFDGARMKLYRINEEKIVMPYLDNISLEYREDEKQIYTGRSRGKGKVIYLSGGGESGYTSFYDPSIIRCAITRKKIPKDQQTYELDTGGVSILSVLISHGYRYTHEGWSNSLIYISYGDRTEIHSSRFTVPEGFQQDIAIERKVLYVDKSLLTTTQAGWTSTPIYYKRNAYSNLQYLFSRYPNLNPCPNYPEQLISRELMVHIKRLSDSWLRDNDRSCVYGTSHTLEECFYRNRTHYDALVSHFKPIAERELARERQIQLRYNTQISNYQ